MTTEMVGTTAAVLEHHLQGIFARDVDEIMRDYTEESVLISANGVAKGLEPIRGFFAYAVSVMTPEVLATAKTIRQEVYGEFAYVLWSAAPAVVIAADTFCIRGGKIVMQSFTAQFGS